MNIPENEKFKDLISNINNQHANIDKYFNTILNSLNSNQEEVKKILPGLVEMALYHFKTEETFMEKINYKNIKSHKLEHNLIKETMIGFLTYYKNGTLEFNKEVVTIFHFLFSKHHDNFDNDYITFFSETLSRSA